MGNGMKGKPKKRAETNENLLAGNCRKKAILRDQEGKK